MSLLSYLIVLVLLSVIGNAFVLISLLCNKKTRSAFDSFIINICILDFLIGAFLKSSFVIEDYFEGQQINDTQCYFMTTLMTAAPTMVLMTLVALLFYVIFSSIKKVRLEKLLSPETTFIIIFMMWFLIGGVHLIYHKVFGNYYGSTCAVEDDILSTTVYCNLTLMLIVIVQLLTMFVIGTIRKASDAFNMRRPEAVYNHLSIEINNNSVDTEDMDGPLRKLIYVQSIMFIIFWIPFYSIRAQYMFDKKSHGLDLIIMQLFFYIIGYFRSAAAPFAVLIVYPESRYLIYKIRDFDYKNIKKIFAKSDSESVAA